MAWSRLAIITSSRSTTCRGAASAEPSRRVVGRVGHHAGVQDGVIGQRAVGPDPHQLAAAGRQRPGPRRAVHIADVDRLTSPQPPGRRRLQLVGPGQRLGIRGTPASGGLVVQARLVHVERRREVEDRLAVLNGLDPAGGERLAVANPVDLVDDRNLWIARPEEVGVQRVDGAALHRPRPAATSAWPATWPPKTRGRESFQLTPREEVDLQLLEVQQGDELVEGLHRRNARGQRCWSLQRVLLSATSRTSQLP